MYCISIYKEVDKEIYYRLIEYCLSKSDAFMLVVWRYNESKMIGKREYIREQIKKLDDILQKDSVEYDEFYEEIISHGYEQYRQSYLKNRESYRKMDESFKKKYGTFFKGVRKVFIKKEK